MKRESKRLVKKTSVIRKVPSFLCFWLLLSVFAPILPNTVFAETEKVPTTDSSTLKTIQSDVVENELPNYNQSSEIKEENAMRSSKEAETSTSMVPENTAPETTEAENKAQKSRGLTRNAEAKITIVDTGIVLKNDGTYLLMDNPEDYAGGIHRPEDVKGSGQYDAQTIVEFANVKDYGLNRLYSEKNPAGDSNTIQQITIAAGSYSELTILSDSDLTIQTDLAYGIHVNRLIIGESEELVWNPVLLKVRAAKVGIYTPDGTKNVTGEVDTSASQAGISMTKETPPVREDYTGLAQFYEKLDQEDAASSSYEALSGTKMLARGTSANGCGAVFASYQLKGTELTGIADGTGYGIFSKEEGITIESIPDAHGQEAERFFEGKLNGTSVSGIGVFVDGYLTNYGGIIRGASTTATGVEAGNYTCDAVSYNGTDYLSELEGTVQSGFGILMRSASVYDGTIYIDPGDMQLNSGKVAGFAAEGTGVFTGSFRIEGNQEVELIGEADSGQGIVAANLLINTYSTPKPKVRVTGNSSGESSVTMAVLLELLSIATSSALTELPTSAGVICLLEFSDQGNDLTLKAQAPTAIAGSYGFYGLDGTEAGINIMAENEVIIEAVGDCGIQTANLEVMASNGLTNTEGLLSIDVNARTTGVRTNKSFKASAPNASTVDGGSKIAITASAGDGIVTSTGVELKFISGYGEENTFKIPVTITAQATGIKSEYTTSNWSPEGIALEGIALTIAGAQEGIKASGLDMYNFNSSELSINTKKIGIRLTGGDSSGMVMLADTSATIVSGEYGLYTEQAYVEITSGYSVGDMRIEVTADQYPVWIDGEVMISNYEKNDESTGSYYDNLSIITTSKGIQPDQGTYPAFYVKDHLVSIAGYSEKIQLIENYQKVVSIPFNPAPSIPYSIAANFNMEKYANYEWEALRTDNNNALVIDQSQIDQNKLFTLDTEYDEAKLTAKRTLHKTGERIFHDEANVANPGQILHEINMIVRREEQYSVIYDSNGADSGTTPTDSNLYSQGDTVNVAPQGDLVKADHKFVGWLNSVDNQIYQNPFLPSTPTTYTMGQEDVTFTAQWQSDSIVEELNLLTNKIPDNLKFGTHKIENSTTKTYYATDSGNDTENAAASDLTKGAVGVEDTRLSTEGWSLTVKQLTQFKTAANQELNGAELSIDVGQPDLSQSTGGAPTGVSNQKVTLTPSLSSQLLLASGGQGKGIVELPIDKFTLEIPGTADKYASEYTTQVEWLVSNVP